MYARGDRSLLLKVVVSAGVDPNAPLVDALIGDGRWLRIRPLPDGTLLLVDLVPGPVDVRLVDARRPQLPGDAAQTVDRR